MTRAERAMQLTVSMYLLDRLRTFIALDRLQLERRRAMGVERGELLRQMGASEHREFFRLKRFWESPLTQENGDNEEQGRTATGPEES